MRTADPHAPTKEKILEAAQKLMLMKGFTATSVDEICAEARATKGSFFHFFKSKEELAEVLTERYAQRQAERFQSAPFQKLPDPMARVFGRIDFAIDSFNDPLLPKACILGNFAQELAYTNPAMRDICARNFARSVELFAQDLDAVKREYALPRETDSRELAELFMSVVQGSMLLVKAQRDLSIAVRNITHFKKYLEDSVFKGAKKRKAALAG